jgi:hypothetical protein
MFYFVCGISLRFWVCYFPLDIMRPPDILQ